MNWTLEMNLESSHPMTKPNKPFSHITFLAEQNNLKLRQELQGSCNESHAKNDRRCVDTMSNDRYCKRLTMSGVGAHLVQKIECKSNSGHGVFDNFKTNFTVGKIKTGELNFEAKGATWNTQ